MHALIAVQKDGIEPGDLTSTDPERRDAVKKLVSDTITSCLKYPHETEEDIVEDYFWRPPSSNVVVVENYKDDIRRLVYSLDQDFRLDENNEFLSADTRKKYYQYQLTNQMHKCMETCWKYSYSTDGEQKCRFHYPVPLERSNSSDCNIYTLYDNKRRKQTKINAPRNNGWVNPLPVHPLLVFANQGNMDIQYISNANGAVEYTCGYISKPDLPDQQKLINIFAKKLAIAIENSETADATLRQQLNAAGAAIAGSQQVGTVQCVYTMLQLPYVSLSRTVYTISSSPTAHLTKNIITDMKQLQDMNPGDSTVSTSPNSHSGRRLAYHLLCQDQHTQYGECIVSLFTMLSYYAVSKPKRRKKNGAPAALIQPKLLTTNEKGTICF